MSQFMIFAESREKISFPLNNAKWSDKTKKKTDKAKFEWKMKLTVKILQVETGVESS